MNKLSKLWYDTLADTGSTYEADAAVACARDDAAQAADEDQRLYAGMFRELVTTVSTKLTAAGHAGPFIAERLDSLIAERDGLRAALLQIEGCADQTGVIYHTARAALAGREEDSK